MHKMNEMIADDVTFVDKATPPEQRRLEACPIGREDAREVEVNELLAVGIELAKAGRLQEAISRFQRAWDIDANCPQALHNLGVAQAELGELEIALASFREATRVRPDYVEAHCGLANTLSLLGRHSEAEGEYRAALSTRPGCIGALNGLGLALNALKRPAEAAVFLREAARLDPRSPGAHGNLGLALAEQGCYAQAEDAFEAALQLDPRYVEAHINLANTYKEQGRLDEALAAYDLALWLRPRSATGHWNRSLALLQAGRYDEGWREYEWRWKRGNAPRTFRCPIWDGSAPEGRTILVHMEQGLGDAMMFVRYASLLRKMDAKVIVEYPAPLAKILPTCSDVDQWVVEGAALPRFDAHVPIMSLPHLCGTTLETVPCQVPYLFADSTAVERWRQRLQGPNLKVGIAWQGNPHHAWDRHRSVKLTEFKPLACVAGVRLVSLQRGPGADQLTQAGIDFDVDDILDRSLSDADSLMEAAAVMTNLDLIVTVDTATAHLAGALGIPVWVVLSTMVDWRWMLHRSDTPWYPTMRLFRQAQRGYWPAVFERVATALVERVTATVTARDK
jgi:tetratricopeptide (TPR) repeat protein